MGSGLSEGIITVFTSTESTARMQSLTHSVCAPKSEDGPRSPREPGHSRSPSAVPLSGQEAFTEHLHVPGPSRRAFSPLGPHNDLCGGRWKLRKVNLVVSWHSKWYWSQDSNLCPVREERLALSYSPWAPWHPNTRCSSVPLVWREGCHGEHLAVEGGGGVSPTTKGAISQVLMEVKWELSLSSAPHPEVLFP